MYGKNPDEYWSVDPKHILHSFSPLIYKLKVKDYSKDVEKYNEKIKAKPKDAESYLSRGFCNYVLQNFQMAQIDFEMVIKLHPKKPEGYVNKSVVLMEKMRYRKR